MIERKIGERFEVNGKLVECVEADGCYSLNNEMCFFGKIINGYFHCECNREICGSCFSRKRMRISSRKDEKDVCFIEVKEQ